jgi:hypothetical protein
MKNAYKRFDQQPEKKKPAGELAHRELYLGTDLRVILKWIINNIVRSCGLDSCDIR